MVVVGALSSTSWAPPLVPVAPADPAQRQSAGLDPSTQPVPDAVELSTTGPGPSALFGALGSDGTGALYSPQSVLAGATAAERDAFGAVEDQAEEDDALLGQPAPVGIGVTSPGTGYGPSAAGGPSSLTGELSAPDRGDLVALQTLWTGAGDGQSEFSAFLGQLSQVASAGRGTASGALRLDVVV